MSALVQRAEPRHLAVDGLNVHYVQAGQGPVVLLVHGLGSSLVTWAGNVAPLADAGFTVLALDLPGHGDSDRPGNHGYDPHSAATLLHDFMAELSIDRASLVGSSAGGLVSALVALEHPEKVERLVMVASGWVNRQVSWFIRLVGLPGVGELVYLPWLHYQVGLSTRVFHEPLPLMDDLLSEVRRVRGLPGSARALLKSIRSSIGYLDRGPQRRMVERLKDSPAPLLTVWGREDPVVPWGQAETMARELPGSMACVMPQCGHWPQMEKADDFNRLVSEFLKGGPGDSQG